MVSQPIKVKIELEVEAEDLFSFMESWSYLRDSLVEQAKLIAAEVEIPKEFSGKFSLDNF